MNNKAINSELSQRCYLPRPITPSSICIIFHILLLATQPHSLIANYSICCIFCQVLPMFLKGWCGQPTNFLLFQDTNWALGLSALPNTHDRLVMWRDLVGASVHGQGS